MALQKYKLLSYNIYGNAIGTDLMHWNPTLIPADKDAFKWSLNDEDGYSDITSLSNIINFGAITKHDYKFIRDQQHLFIIDMANNAILGSLSDPPNSPSQGDVYTIIATATGDWTGKEGLLAMWDGSAWVFFGMQEKSAEEELGFVLVNDLDTQILLASQLIGTFQQQVDVFVQKYGPVDFIEEKQEAQEVYKIETQVTRKARFEHVTVLLHQHLPMNTPAILFSIQPHSSDRYYYEQGYDGIAYGDIHPDLGGRGLADYIFGDGIWDGIGLKDQEWYSVLTGETMETFHLLVADVLFETGLVK